MGAGIGLFLGWENGIGVTGTGPLGMGNESLKMGMVLRCQLISNFLHFLSLSQIENFI